MRASLRRYGALLAQCRAFMAARDIIEVDTPLLRACPAADPNSRAMAVDGATAWLQSSPETAMKRLLAAGSGPIYQLGHVFRAAEHGRLHTPEFTMLEWYRPGFDYRMLMREVGELLLELGLPEPQCREYAQAFYEHTGLKAHTVALAPLQEYAYRLGLRAPCAERAALLDFILSTRLAPELGHGVPIFLSDFPACQAVQAIISTGEPPVARRFELFGNGMELANGCCELVEPVPLRQRLHALGVVDPELLMAATRGIPACAGVALGVDRLYMMISGATHIAAAQPARGGCPEAG